MLCFDLLTRTSLTGAHNEKLLATLMRGQLRGWAIAAWDTSRARMTPTEFLRDETEGDYVVALLRELNAELHLIARRRPWQFLEGPPRRLSSTPTASPDASS